MDSKMTGIVRQDKQFFAEIAELLTAARGNAYRAVNSVMVETYWNIGRRIVEHEQDGKNRANYGEKLIENLSRYLTDIFGKGFSEANLQNIRRFYLTFPEFPTRRVGNLAWSHLIRIMRLDESAAVAKEGAKAAKDAREQIEKSTGKPVVSKLNARDLRQHPYKRKSQ
jgi:hypothetical protein